MLCKQVAEYYLLESYKTSCMYTLSPSQMLGLQFYYIGSVSEV